VSVYVHPSGICESDQVGDGTRVWAFAHVLPGARIGANCNINDHVFIENDVVVGDRVTVKSGVQLWDGVRLGDDVFVGPNATFTNDLFPRSKEYPEAFAETVVGPGASIGGGAVILPGVRIGRRAMVGAGAIVVRDVPAHAIVVGNPARIVGYTDSALTPGPGGPDQQLATRPEDGGLPGGARLIHVQTATDLRGSLAAVEFESGLPFVPRRFFSVFGVPSKEVRGEHAHRECAQVLVCLKGSVHCIVDDGSHRREVRLESPAVALHVPPMLWGTQYRYSDDAVLAVFASHPYDPNDYIREYERFLAEVAGRGG
jgi:UDP-2-acetamido-3-amino-2,3-dideoxy-glucuronate N-acetyltransferase